MSDNITVMSVKEREELSSGDYLTFFYI